jgi:hypothetical protein
LSLLIAFLAESSIIEVWVDVSEVLLKHCNYLGELILSQVTPTGNFTNVFGYKLEVLAG